MYEINDYVVYTTSEICRISDIKTDPIPGMEAGKEYYVLHPVLDPQSTIYTPIYNERGIVRGIHTKDELLEILDRIPYIRTIQAPTAKIRRELYEEALSKYDCIEWIQIIKTMYVLKDKGPSKGRRMISDAEAAYTSKAKTALHSEVSLVLNVPYNEVESYIERYVEQLLETDS